MSICVENKNEDNFVHLPPKRGEATSKERLKSYRGSEHVMFIDDEESLINVTRSMLEHLGYKVTAFMDPNKSLAAFESQQDLYSVIISDHLMPEISGIELLKKFRKVSATIPIILCTGQTDVKLIECLKDMGHSGLLTKPYTLPQIGETVRKVMDYSLTKQPCAT